MSKLLISSNSNEAKRLSRLYMQKKVRRVYQGIYTDNMIDPLEKIVQEKWMDIIPCIVTEGILSFRTAKEIRPVAFGNKKIVFVTSTYAKTVHLPGLIIKVIKGNNQDYIEWVLPDLAKSCLERMLLENLSTVRGQSYKGVKTIGVEGVENFLVKELKLRGEDNLNQIRDKAKLVASKLGFNSEYKILNQKITALLMTHPDTDFLVSKQAKALVNKKPFDSGRVTQFENLCIYLKKCRFIKRKYEYKKTSYNNLSFYESYFSNYIEGTEFIIDEAEEIVFQGKEIKNRHEDSHDILANFNLTNDLSEMNNTPSTPQELLELLQDRHAYLMKERPNKQPGKFKDQPNHAGNTYFVSPAEVIGTLCQGFQFYETLNNGIEKALFIHLLISEVHPFVDGNGRLSRIMMNAELVKEEQYKIIIPTVHRDNYLNGLRLASRDMEFRTYCKVIDQAQAYAASINWLDYGEAREKIELDYADQVPDEGLPMFNRVLRELPLSDFAV